jgi:hypothetical protein
MSFKTGVVSFFLLLTATVVYAGSRDPWYLAYVVRGGNIVQYMGPYNSYYRCYAMKNRIPRGTEFVGCFQ